jgi:hypothetical protein
MAMTFISFSLFITLVVIFVMAIEIYEQYLKIQEMEEANKELRLDAQDNSVIIFNLNKKITDIYSATKIDDKGYPMIIINKIKEILTEHQSI